MLSRRLVVTHHQVLFRIKNLPTISVISSRGHRNAAVRVRFAPSPTGEMHLGGLRTALYNFLFARHNKGDFILRIEDTDQSRLVPGSQDRIVEILKWAGLHPDEGPDSIGGPKGPYIQSQRLEFYREFTQKLIDSGAAYRCFCTEWRLNLIRKDAQRRREVPKYDNKCRHLSEEELAKCMAEGTPHVVRFKLKEGPLTFKDVVLGEITLDLSAVEGDFILMKSDGFPTYHLANVVDDHLMQITHVLRGIEWQLSTPKHIQMFEALGLEPPTYAHLPLLTDEHGLKLSKRHRGFLCESLRSEFMPQAVLNFLLLSGGGLGKTTGKLHSMEDLIEKFRLENLNTAPCKLDLSRLKDMNRQAIMTTGESVQDEAFEIVRKEYPNVDKEYFVGAFNVVKERLSALTDLMSSELEFLWKDLPQEKIVPDDLKDCFEALLDALENSSFGTEELQQLLKNFQKDHLEAKGCNYVKFMKLMRKLLSDHKDGLKVTEMMIVLGKATSISRIKRGL